MRVTQLFVAADKALEELVNGLSSEIQNSATKNDFDEVAALSGVASRINSAKKLVADEQKKLGPLSPDPAQQRSFAVCITEGALKQSYLSVTEGINQRLLKDGQSIDVKLPDGHQFKTTVMHNRLQERGHIAKFYAKEHVEVDNCVGFIEITPGLWSLIKLP